MGVIKFKEDLERFGIYGRGITEVISTTISKRGINAAPIGLINKDLTYVEVFKERNQIGDLVQGKSKIFTCHTYENLFKDGNIGINVTYNPLFFVESAFNDLKEEDYFFLDDFPFLKDSHAIIKFEVDGITEEKHFCRFYLKFSWGKVLKREVIGINRGFNLLLELTILATRRRITNRYDELYPFYSPIIKNCGDERMIKALERLNKLADSSK
jgi:Uncharacterized conserved protein